MNGEVYEIDKWFDSITGEKNSYKELTESLEKVYQLELEYVNKKMFKKLTLNKITDISKKIIRIVEKFNNSVNFR